jgi:hypothetical protein
MEATWGHIKSTLQQTASFSEQQQLLSFQHQTVAWYAFVVMASTATCKLQQVQTLPNIWSKIELRVPAV